MYKVFILTLLLTVLAICTLSGCSSRNNELQSFVNPSINNSNNNEVIQVMPDVSNNRSYENAIEKFVEAMNGNTAVAEALAPPGIECRGCSYTPEIAKYVIEKNRTELVEKYSESIHFDLTLIGAQKASSDELKVFIKWWVEAYHGDPDDFEGAYILDLLPTVQNAEGLKLKDYDMGYAAVNICGNWYLCQTKDNYFVFAAHQMVSSRLALDAINQVDPLPLD